MLNDLHVSFGQAELTGSFQQRSALEETKLEHPALGWIQPAQYPGDASLRVARGLPSRRLVLGVPFQRYHRASPIAAPDVDDCGSRRAEKPRAARGLVEGLV